jgi:serine protease AprX
MIMPESCGLPVRSTERRRTWRAAAAVTVGLLLAAAVGTPASGSTVAEAPTEQQIAWWADGAGADLDGLALVLGSAGAAVVDRLPVASAVVVTVPRGWQPPAGVAATPDRAMRVAGSHSTPPTAFEPRAAGPSATVAVDDTSTGEGVTVALVDTGVAAVGDLRGSVRHVNVSGAAAGDGYGHGTFLAGLIAGSGVASHGAYRGVAPKADILDVQVAAPDGSTSLRRVLAGLQAVADRARHDDSLRVVNLSLSADDPNAPGLDPLSRALEALWDRGLVVIVAAGNEGPNPGTVTLPGTDAAVITVGALDAKVDGDRSDDTVAPFSSRGTPGARNIKPDLVAPAVSVVGLRAPGSVVDSEHPGSRVGPANFVGSGTSMAAAVTSAAVARLLSVLPDLEPEDVKAALTEGAYTVPGDRTATGAGGLDLPGARDAAARLGQEQASWAGDDVTAAIERFTTAWRTGSQSEALAAWLAMPVGLRARAAAAWATTVAADEQASDEQVALARAWALDSDLGAAWLTRSWSARSWSARSWSARSWSARSWSARSWSARSWSARSWSARSWSARSWSARSWSARSWSARSWSVVEWGPGSP